MKIFFEEEAAEHISKMDAPLPDEVEAIVQANQSIAENGTVAYDAID